MGLYKFSFIKASTSQITTVYFQLIAGNSCHLMDTSETIYVFMGWTFLPQKRGSNLETKLPPRLGTRQDQNSFTLAYRTPVSRREFSNMQGMVGTQAMPLWHSTEVWYLKRFTLQQELAVKNSQQLWSISRYYQQEIHILSKIVQFFHMEVGRTKSTRQTRSTSYGSLFYESQNDTINFPAPQNSSTMSMNRLFNSNGQHYG